MVLAFSRVHRARCVLEPPAHAAHAMLMLTQTTKKAWYVPKRSRLQDLAKQLPQAAPVACVTLALMAAVPSVAGWFATRGHNCTCSQVRIAAP